MKKQILALSLLLGLFAVPVIGLAADCGPGPLGCVECLTEETCAAEVSCTWDVDCQYVAAVPLVGGDMTTLLAYVGGLFTDAKLLVLLAIGVPLGFLIIRRAMDLMPKK